MDLSDVRGILARETIAAHERTRFSLDCVAEAGHHQKEVL